MKKSIALLLAALIAVAGLFAGCHKTNNEGNENPESSSEGLADNAENFGFETVEVTDDNGKKVTDANGDTVTTEVAVKYEVNKKGDTVAIILDDDGEKVTDKKGNTVTIKTDVDITTTTTKKTTEKEKIPTTKKHKTTASTTVTTQKNEYTTEAELTTISSNKDKVPATSATGKVVTFSTEDQQIIKSMLEVPYLYEASYENADGIPVEIAAHAALWMAEREGLNTSTYASGTIVLDLFKYFGQTVVNFKTNCNSADNDLITYVAKNDTFSITDFENKKQDVTITKFEQLGNNNYYKVEGNVKDAGNIKKVVAIVQRNKLDPSLGFSIKALKWS